MYRFGILTSLYDDYAPQLLRTIDENIEDGTIDAEAFLVCNLISGVKEGDFNRRLEIARQLKHLGKNVILFSSKDFRRKDPKWRDEHDLALKEKLPQAGSYLNVGYMQWMTEILYDSFDIVNLHPAIPDVGPIGIWKKVMEEQAQRPLEEVQRVTSVGEVIEILNKRVNRAGGMLHLVTKDPDRGPVISYYEFGLTSPTLLSVFYQVALRLRENPLEDVKKEAIWQRLAGENGLIRRHQFAGEEPFLVLTYNRLTHDRWKIENRMLYVKEDDLWVPHPNGYCLNQEIGEWLRERGIKSLIT